MKGGQQLLARNSPRTQFLVLLFVMAILVVFSVYEPKSNGYSIFNRTWGYDHITCYGLPETLLFFVFCLVVLFPPANIFIQKALEKLAGTLSRFGRKKLLLFMLVSVAGAFVFYLLRVKYYFLGDMEIRMNQVMQKQFLTTEYLTMKVLYYFTTLMGKLKLSTDAAFKLYSYIAGAVYLFLSCLIANTAGKNTFQKLLLFLAQCGSALLMLFCGYVEIYATPVVLLTLYILFCLRYLHGKSNFLLAVLSLGLAVASHLLCIAALPSLLVVWYLKNKTKFPSISNLSNGRKAMVIAVALIVGLITLFYLHNSFVLPLSPPVGQANYMTLFSIAHVWEFVNGQLLCCGLSFIFIFILIYKAILSKLVLSNEIYFLFSFTGFITLLIFLANLHRGSGDWDIMAFSAIGLNLLVMLLIFRMYASNITGRNYLAVALIALNGINAFLWLHINHTDKSVQKIKQMFITDPGTYYTSRISGSAQVLFSLKNNKLYTEFERFANEMRAHPKDIVDEVSSTVVYCDYLNSVKRQDEVKVIYENFLANRNPFVIEGYLFLIDYYYQRKQIDAANYYIDRFFLAYNTRPELFQRNPNFKPAGTVEIFEYLYKLEAPKNNKPKLEALQQRINELKNFKK